MGRKNKVVKLTDRKINYIIWAKTRDEVTMNIARDMKISESTVKRVWMYWLKHGQPISIRKFGRPKKEIDENLEQLILKFHQEQQFGARRLEEIIEFKSGIRLSHRKRNGGNPGYDTNESIV